MTKINQRTNRQTNQPTQINQPKSNQPKPTQTNHFQLLQPCYLEAGCNFSGRCCHSLGWCTTSLPCLFLQRGCPPKGVGGGHLWRCWLKIPHNPRKLKECHLKKREPFQKDRNFLSIRPAFFREMFVGFSGEWHGKLIKNSPLKREKSSEPNLHLLDSERNIIISSSNTGSNNGEVKNVMYLAGWEIATCLWQIFLMSIVILHNGWGR